MKWNWQQKGWPNFSYNKILLKEFETEFLHKSGILLGSHKHISDKDQNTLTIDLLSNEALKTSEIEGEYLDRDSVQSSIRRNFGLDTYSRKIPPAEQGISEMMVDLYRDFATPLSHTILFKWHKMLTKGHHGLRDIGHYRTHLDSMQVVSGHIHKPKIHFEAPPSKKIQKEMKRFITWYNKTAPNSKTALPPLTRSGMAHLYFVCIHPFEDGNGRIGRAISEKALSQYIEQPTLIALSQTIQNHRQDYYHALELSNKKNEITSWLVYFAKTILKAQEHTQKLVDFIVEKTKLYDRVRDQLNPRQDKVIARMFREGPSGFRGGLSADNYITITHTSRATATRDLQDLVNKHVLFRTGELKGTRYHLNTKHQS